MAQKWNLQDIRPAKSVGSAPHEAPIRKGQQDIAPRASKVESSLPAYDPDLATIDVIDGNSAKRKRVTVTVIVALVIVGVGFFVNVLLGGAEVTVYPKAKNISVHSEFTAYKTPQVGDLGY